MSKYYNAIGNLVVVGVHISVLVVIIAYIFNNSLANSWAFDDYLAIINNKDIPTNVPYSSIWRNDIWGKSLLAFDSHRSFRPLLVAIFKRLRHAYDLDASAFRLVSIYSHQIATVLLYFLGWVVVGDKHLSFGASLLFATHPVHVEGVAAVVNMAEPIQSCLCMLAFMIYYLLVTRSTACCSHMSIVAPSITSTTVQRPTTNAATEEKNSSALPVTQSYVSAFTNMVWNIVQLCTGSLLCFTFICIAYLVKETGVTVAGVIAACSGAILVTYLIVWLFNKRNTNSLIMSISSHVYWIIFSFSALGSYILLRILIVIYDPIQLFANIYVSAQFHRVLKYLPSSVHSMIMPSYSGFHQTRPFELRNGVRISITQIINAVYKYCTGVDENGNSNSFYLGNSQLIRRAENPFSFLVGEEKMYSLMYLHFRYFYQLWNPEKLAAEYAYNCIPSVSTLDDPRMPAVLLLYCALLVVVLIGLYALIQAVYKYQTGSVTSKYKGSTRNSSVANNNLRLLFRRYDVKPEAVLVGMCWLIVPFLPAAGVFLRLGTLLAERLLYMPSIGYCILMSVGLYMSIQIAIDALTSSLILPVLNILVREFHNNNGVGVVYVNMKVDPLVENDAMGEKVRLQEHTEEVDIVQALTVGEYDDQCGILSPGLSTSQDSVDDDDMPTLVPVACPKAAKISSEGVGLGVVGTRISITDGDSDDGDDEDVGKEKEVKEVVVTGAATMTQVQQTTKDAVTTKHKHKTVNIYHWQVLLGKIVYWIGIVYLTLWYSQMTIARNPAWKDDPTLHQETLKVCPTSAKVQLQVGRMYLNEGKYDKASSHIAAAKKIDPDFCDIGYQEALLLLFKDNNVVGAMEAAANNLGCVFTNKQSFELLAKLWEQQLQAHPNNPAVLEKHGDLLVQAGLHALAAQKYQMAMNWALEAKHFEQSVLLSMKSEKTTLHFGNQSSSPEEDYILHDLRCTITMTGAHMRLQVQEKLNSGQFKLSSKNVNKLTKQINRGKELLFKTMQPDCIVIHPSTHQLVSNKAQTALESLLALLQTSFDTIGKTKNVKLKNGEIMKKPSVNATEKVIILVDFAQFSEAAADLMTSIINAGTVARSHTPSERSQLQQQSVHLRKQAVELWTQAGDSYILDFHSPSSHHVQGGSSSPVEDYYAFGVACYRAAYRVKTLLEKEKSNSKMAKGEKKVDRTSWAMLPNSLHSKNSKWVKEPVVGTEALVPPNGADHPQGNVDVYKSSAPRWVDTTDTGILTRIRQLLKEREEKVIQTAVDEAKRLWSSSDKESAIKSNKGVGAKMLRSSDSDTIGRRDRVDSGKNSLHEESKPLNHQKKSKGSSAGMKRRRKKNSDGERNSSPKKKNRHTTPPSTASSSRVNENSLKRTSTGVGASERAAGSEGKQKNTAKEPGSSANKKRKVKKVK